MIKIGVSGARGKMGRRIIALAKEDRQIEVRFGFEYAGCPEINKTIDGILITSDWGYLKSCDCLIEFSTPGAAIEHLSYLTQSGITAVIGTTGFDENQITAIKDAAKKIPLVFSPNMSVGVNIFFRLIKAAAENLSKYGYRVNIEEAHHLHKKDAPSGTAKKIAAIANEYKFGIKNENIKSIREGEIAGDHKIIFESGVDRIELFHSAKTRDIFAQGALLAAKWVAGKPVGLYSLEEVLFGK